MLCERFNTSTTSENRTNGERKFKLTVNLLNDEGNLHISNKIDAKNNQNVTSFISQNQLRTAKTALKRLK